MTNDKTGSPLRDFLAACRMMPERDRRNARTANLWLFAWCVTFLPALYFLTEDRIPPGPLSWLAALVPIALSIGGVLAFVRFLREADELQRRIQVEALALGFGAGFVAGFGLQLLEEIGWGSYDAPDTFSVMAIFYLIGILVGSRRYL